MGEFDWARTYGADQLSAFIEDLRGAASASDGLQALDAVEEVIARHRPGPGPQGEQSPCPLDSGQLRLLERMARGDSCRESAVALGMTGDAIRAARSRLFTLLGVRRAGHAVALAVHHGWLSVSALDLPPVPTTAGRVRRHPLVWRAVYREHASALRAQPGTWLPTGPYSCRSNASRAASRIVQGLDDAYRPAGSFDAEPFLDDTREWSVRARFAGTPDTTPPGDAR